MNVMTKSKGFIEEFLTFIKRGNVVDLAVGVVIGSAFSKIVSSLVDDIIMPLLSLLTGGLDFSALSIALGSGDGAATLNYGAFIAAIINFLLIALVIFVIIKSINKVSKKPEEPAAEPTTKICPRCQMEISIKATRCPHCTSEQE